MAVIIFKIVEHYGKEVLVLFKFFGFQLEITVVTAGKQILTCYVTVVPNFVIFVGKWVVTVEAGSGCSMSPPVDVGHAGHGNLFGQNVVEDFSFCHYVLIKVGHDIGTAVYCGKGLILW